MGKNQPELKLMQSCYTWFNNTYPELRGCLWKVENERKRTKYEQSIAKSTGLVSGVADFNAVFCGKFYGLELKTENGTQSKNQKAWQKAIEAQGGEYYIIRSLEEFQGLITQFYNLLKK